MADLITHLAERTLGLARVLQPRLASLFAPEPFPIAPFPATPTDAIVTTEHTAEPPLISASESFAKESALPLVSFDRAALPLSRVPHLPFAAAQPEFISALPDSVPDSEHAGIGRSHSIDKNSESLPQPADPPVVTQQRDGALQPFVAEVPAAIGPFAVLSASEVERGQSGLHPPHLNPASSRREGLKIQGEGLEVTSFNVHGGSSEAHKQTSHSTPVRFDPVLPFSSLSTGLPNLSASEPKLMSQPSLAAPGDFAVDAAIQPSVVAASDSPVNVATQASAAAIDPPAVSSEQVIQPQIAAIDPPAVSSEQVIQPQIAAIAPAAVPLDPTIQPQIAAIAPATVASDPAIQPQIAAVEAAATPADQVVQSTIGAINPPAVIPSEQVIQPQIAAIDSPAVIPSEQVIQPQIAAIAPVATPPDQAIQPQIAATNPIPAIVEGTTQPSVTPTNLNAATPATLLSPVSPTLTGQLAASDGVIQRQVAATSDFSSLSNAAAVPAAPEPIATNPLVSPVPTAISRSNVTRSNVTEINNSNLRTLETSGDLGGRFGLQSEPFSAQTAAAAETLPQSSHQPQNQPRSQFPSPQPVSEVPTIPPITPATLSESRSLSPITATHSSIASTQAPRLRTIGSSPAMAALSVLPPIIQTVQPNLSQDMSKIVAPVEGRDRRSNGAPLTPPPAPTIQVTIGRIDIRAVPAAPSARTRSSSSTARMSLTDYLKTRQGGNE
jgi:hypothetical protein